MSVPTEERNPRSLDLDRLSAAEIVALMNREEAASLRAVEEAADAIAVIAEEVAAAYVAGGRIAYVGAGTSGLIALTDALEIPPTFGVAPERFIALVAGGPAGSRAVISAAEDDVDAGPAALDERGFGSRDYVIGVAASGSTPFVVATVAHASQLGCGTCGIANNPGSSLLVAGARAVLLDTGPEVVTGSTRLKAGTAQKLTLNRISTAAMVLAGHVQSNLMIELTPGTAKLRDRCIRIVSDLTGVDTTRAEELLVAENWSLRAAVNAANAQKRV